MPGVAASVLVRQERVVAAVQETGAELHLHYRPGFWVPCSAGTRCRESLATVAAAVYGILPLDAVADRAALVDSTTGQRWPLDRLL